MAAEGFEPSTFGPDSLFVATWRPAIYDAHHDTLPGIFQGPPTDPATDPGVGWSYYAPGAFMDRGSPLTLDDEGGTPCGYISGPIGASPQWGTSLQITGDWPIGTKVTVYWPGFVDSSGAIQKESLSGKKTPAELIPFSGPGCKPTSCSQPALSWTVTSTAEGATFPDLAIADYSVWIGNVLLGTSGSECSDVTVRFNQSNDYVCDIPTGA
ncbi:MAG TPA: hypothetical protein VGS21_06585 [Acidimicrobiales bacterium]|nr:hypothetical protein [Acidimicrobiales bacterium]